MEFVFDAWYVAGWSRNFQRALVPLVLLEQNLHFAKAVANAVIVIEGGEKKFDGSIEELNQNPQIKDKYLAV